jgi:hypothetical protein
VTATDLLREASLSDLFAAKSRLTTEIERLVREKAEMEVIRPYWQAFTDTLYQIDVRFAALSRSLEDDCPKPLLVEAR